MAEHIAEEVGKPADAAARVSGRFSGVRDGLGLAAVVVFLVTALALILLVVGLSKRLARETIPELTTVPGGFWAVGAALGLITVFGSTAGLRAARPTADSTRLTRAWRAVLTAFCCALAFGPFLYLLSGLRSRNCRSSDCAYVPGTGPAFLTYAVTSALVGWLLYRRHNARAERLRAQERERMRRLRKRGKGRTRTARRR
ncbi:hypothetical protein [Streptomyces indiaensis]|uniref:Integral membrane protein n=1 Tax=Streptomyces indiaensis TaxID=284033 RepID=A0ABN3DNY4_9ACTN|nr:hypothetical protein [Streptomyces indiaensis]MCF1648164.1 hypothetical protein [Streptomyces indiaensis]